MKNRLIAIWLITVYDVFDKLEGKYEPDRPDISLSGDRYFYENPLIAKDHCRWQWHDCPCCPPMILKMAGALPRYIYAYDDDGVYINLFISSEAGLSLKGSGLHLRQTTAYPCCPGNRSC